MQTPLDPLSYFMFCMTMKFIYCHSLELAIGTLSVITLGQKCYRVPI